MAGDIKSECRARSSRNRGRLPSESAWEGPFGEQGIEECCNRGGDPPPERRPVTPGSCPPGAILDALLDEQTETPDRNVFVFSTTILSAGHRAVAPDCRPGAGEHSQAVKPGGA